MERPLWNNDESGTIGARISEIMTDVESTLLEYAMYVSKPPRFTEEGLRASLYVFMSFMTDASWNLMEEEKMKDSDRGVMIESLGTELRKLVKVYTGIDTFEMFKK